MNAMKTLKVNREFLVRHLAVCLLMLGMGCWFGYDGLVTYRRAPAAELYEKIESAKPPEGFPLEAFKEQKIKTQYGFAILCLVASALIGLHLASVAAFRFDWDESSFVWNGKRYQLSDVKSADRSKWKSKGILRLTLSDGTRVTLDAWHHVGVKEFEKMV